MELPTSAQKFYDDVYDSVKDKGDARATAIAWGAVKNRLTMVNGKIVANAENFVTPELFTFDLENTSDLIINASGDEITFEGVLATTGYFIQGFKRARFSESALMKLADQINNMSSTVPDLDHEVLSNIAKTPGLTKGLIMNAIQSSKGLIKKIEAIYKDGKLWIKGVLDGRYRKTLPAVKGMSIEAWTDKIGSDGETIEDATYLGFTFAKEKNPKDVNARISSYT